MPDKLYIAVVGDAIDANGNSIIPEQFIDKEHTLIIKKIPYAEKNYWQFFDADIDGILLLKDEATTLYSDFITILKTKKNNIPLLVAGSNDVDEEIQSYKDGATVYFSYPLNFRKIVALLGNLSQDNKVGNNYSAMPATTALVIKSRDEFFKEFKKFVLLNLDKGISIEKISAGMKISSKTLTRRVKQYLFTTPAALVTEIKLDYAKKLLSARRFSVKKVSFMAGFNSPQRFNTVFKGQEGLTPMQYIKKN